MNWLKTQKEDDKVLQAKLQAKGKIPRHVAVIMDGNGRWAAERTFPRLNGHREGIESVRDIVKAASQIGVEYLTLYAFSLENWQRPVSEVSGLMKLLDHFLKKEIDELNENGVRFQVIGKINALPKDTQNLLNYSLEKTKDNKGLTLILALSYGSRWDIVRAVQMIALEVRRGKLSPEDVDESLLSSYLQTAETPDPDLLIRTSGELRLSNFLLWEMAYGELYVSNKLWPDFRRADFYEALDNYLSRERRYGKTSQQVKNESESYLQRVINVIKNK